MPSRLADLIRKARRLAAERDRLIEDLAGEWTHALRGQGLSIADLEELWAGLVDGTVDAIATDHAPHPSTRKDVEFDQAAFGISGLETAISLVFGGVRAGWCDRAMP